ncbi:MAG: hypothetical protein SFV21_11150 [Rhodospirillaceae bacterium]|nr:hypothetical protein [Rhodospirillaceae bacterium]
MSADFIARGILLGAAVTTLAVMMFAAGGALQSDTGETFANLLLLPFLAAWAVGPYFICNRFMSEAEPRARWAYLPAALIVALPVLWFYVDGLVIHEQPDAQITIVFVVFPLYQFVFVLAVYYAVRFWGRFSGPSS